MSLRRFLFATSFVPVLLLAGCGHHKTEQGGTDNILRYPLLARPTTFDPAMVRDGTTIDLLQNLCEGLVQWTTDNKLAPDIAKSWDISKDGLTYTFHLRDDVKFQDGNPVTADDFYYTMRRALQPALKSPVAMTYLGNIVGADEVNKGTAAELTGVKVIDPHTLEIKIKQPGLYWIYTLTYPTAYVLSKKEALEGKEMSDKDLAAGAGTGPFRLESYEPDQQVKTVANASYFEGAPKLAGIIRPIVTNADTRHSMYEQGQIDVVDEQRGTLTADLQNPALKDEVKFWARAATFYVGLNQKQIPQFKDIRVRQALAYATNKADIKKIALGDRVEIAEDILPNGIPGADPNFKGLPYDPAKARELLAQAGYPGGKGMPTLTMTYRDSYPEIESAVNLIAEQWKENLGVKVEGRRTEWSVMLGDEDKDLLPTYYIRWAADYLDPQDYYTVLLSTTGPENHVSYSNPKFDALCKAADFEQDPVKRNALYRQAAVIVANEVPCIPLYYQKDAELVKPYVRDIEDGLMGHLPYKRTYIQK